MPNKDVFWLKHDYNASDDEAICDMRAKYKAEGYGWYWILVEMMCVTADYRLTHSRINAFAMRMQCTPVKASDYIKDCIEIFKLFESDGEYFWSERLLRDMKDKIEKSEKARQSALARYEKTPAANAERTHANAERKSALRGEEKRIEEINNTPHISPKKEDDAGEEDESVKIPAEYMVMIEAHTTNTVLRQAICEWFLMRKGKGKRYAVNTPYTLQLTLNKAKKIFKSEAEQIDGFNEATEKSWQTVFEPAYPVVKSSSTPQLPDMRDLV